MRKFKTLFLDIGGVLLTNGWDREARKKSASAFAIDPQELEDRHRLIFTTYEAGKLTLEDYLDHVIFYKGRNFSHKAYKNFMFDQSQQLGNAIEYFKQIKKEFGCKVVAVSNEVKELNDHRIKKYKLTELFDFFISSCYVQLRKPDPDMFMLACTTTQTLPEDAFFIDDRLLYIEMAAKLGIPGHQFISLQETTDFFNQSFQ